ncbi:hypothetical protein L7F22_067369 [Adiantum nelumboides]|nr:hypothetical protein [Adiantum nelumboides]
MSAFTVGVTKPDGTLEQSRVTKLPARCRIEEVTIDGGQSTSQKGVCLKRRKKGQSNNADLEDNKEKKSRESWKDGWVVQLIHIRGAKHGEFGRPPKQGGDLWSKVATELASLFPECDKDGQACRKKWGRVYNSYKRDKAHNSISGNDHRVTCEWYDIVDEDMHSKANVVSESHASAIGGKDGMEVAATSRDAVICSGLNEALAKLTYTFESEPSLAVERAQDVGIAPLDLGHACVFIELLSDLPMLTRVVGGTEDNWVKKTAGGTGIVDFGALFNRAINTQQVFAVVQSHTVLRLQIVGI